MDIANQKLELFNLDITKSLGLTIDFQLLQNWMNKKEEIAQAFVLSRLDDNTKVTAFIELKKTLSKKQKHQYVDSLKNEMFNIFRNYLLPCSFALAEDLNDSYCNKTFKNEVLKQKFGSWEVLDT